MPFKKFYVSQPDVSNDAQLQRAINTLQQNVEESINNIEKKSILNSVIKENVTINTSVDISHGLGRKPVGYFIIKKNSNANIWDTNITEDTLSLASSASTVVSIYIF